MKDSSQQDLDEIERHTAAVWVELEAAAVEAGLDPTKFGSIHREVIGRIIAFLAKPQPIKAHPPPQTKAVPQSGLTGWVSRNLFGRSAEKAVPSLDAEMPPVEAVQPIIICGEPGTGKTTFLYVLDRVLRQHFGLPDNVSAAMEKSDGRRQMVPKRLFDGRPVSLLSVKKWAELLRFFTWDVYQHKMIFADLDQFIEQRLAPMRVLFADEVEMYGYSPTLPNLAKHGILVVGTSNQYEFAQLVIERTPPLIYQFGGLDMRAGDPADAAVPTSDHCWRRFNWLMLQPSIEWEMLSAFAGRNSRTDYLGLDFKMAVKAPMLETNWIEFFQHGFLSKATEDQGGIAHQILLFFDYDLQYLRQDYNTVIRFVSIFDAIEQLEIGVLFGNGSDRVDLSRDAIEGLKESVQNAVGVTAEIKKKTLVGLDRCASRIGQAGFRARQAISTEGG